LHLSTHPKTTYSMTNCRKRSSDDLEEKGSAKRRKKTQVENLVAQPTLEKDEQDISGNEKEMQEESAANYVIVSENKEKQGVQVVPHRVEHRGGRSKRKMEEEVSEVHGIPGNKDKEQEGSANKRRKMKGENSEEQAAPRMEFKAKELTTNFFPIFEVLGEGQTWDHLGGEKPKREEV